MEQMRVYESDEQKLKVYGHRLHQAEQAFEQWEAKGKQYIGRYMGIPREGQFSGNGHHIAVPDGTSVIDSLFSSLTAADIDVAVKAVGQGTRDQERLASAALGKEWETTKATHRASRAIKDSLLVGIGWVKVSYEYHSTKEQAPRRDEDISADIEVLIREAEADGHDIDALTIANYVPVVEDVEYVTVDRIVVDYVPWNRVLWDPTAKTMEDVRWHAQVSFMHPEEVKNHPTFKEYCARTKCAQELEDLGSDSRVELWGENPNQEDERVTIIELHDYETGTVCTFARHADFLLNEAPGLFGVNEDLEDKTPFVPCVLRVAPGRVRGVGEMEIMTPTLEELDLYHTRLATYLERMAPKVIGKKGAMSDAGREAMASQEYGAFAELEQGFEVNDITDFKPPVLPSEVYGVVDKLRMSLKEATGLNELMRGLFPDRKRTATETAEVVQASAARQAEKRVQLERFYEAIASRILQLMQMMYSQERLVRYVDERGPIEWSWTNEDIVMDSKLEIVLTPKEVKDWQTRRDEALAMLNILGPLSQPGPNGESVVDQTELTRYVLEEFGLPQSTITMLLNLPEEKQMQQMAAQQAAAGMQAAQGLGIPRPDMTSGPMNAGQVARATNQGEIPPEMLAAAFGNTPVSPGAAEVVSESSGVAIPPA